MLYVLLSCVSFILLSKSLCQRPLPGKIKYFTPWFLRGFLSSLAPLFRGSEFAVSFFPIEAIMLSRKTIVCSKVERVEEEEGNSLLDLPELALEYILERLPPAGLSSVSAVCKSLRDRCRRDYLWEKHMKHKWGRLIKDAAHREWQWHIATRSRTSPTDQNKKKSLLGVFISFWPFPLIKQNIERSEKPKTSLPADSVMALFISLERGNFWFPAQVYNRENGHAGFILSCYDAKVVYDSRKDSFLARYSHEGRRTIEDNIQWYRLRAPPVDTPAHDLHISDCLNDLKPGDHIEIQWRRSKDFPYGWWYGVVGHLDSCNRNNNHCLCCTSDIVILEFNQYTLGSRWRRATIDRKQHREEGNEVDGFYGGIRKLYSEVEISMWKRLWPTKVLE